MYHEQARARGKSGSSMLEVTIIDVAANTLLQNYRVHTSVTAHMVVVDLQTNQTVVPLQKEDGNLVLLRLRCCGRCRWHGGSLKCLELVFDGFDWYDLLV